MGKCYIVGAGDFGGGINPQGGDIVIAADGGYDSLVSRGITPDVLIGDLDSIHGVPHGIETHRFPVRKDDTDMFIAYREGRARGYRDFEIHGGTGGREDHTFANYALLLTMRRAGDAGVLVSDASRTYVLLNEERKFRGTAGTHISVFAFGGTAHGVTIRGAEYGAENIDMTPDYPLGVSNVMKDGDMTVSVRDGALLVIQRLFD